MEVDTDADADSNKPTTLDRKMKTVPPTTAGTTTASTYPPHGPAE